MKLSLPPQIARLLALTCAIVVLYFVARHFLVPESYGQYGPYRGASLGEIAAAPITYAGRVACAECHADEDGKLAQGAHKEVSCEACHGPALRHADAPLESAPVIKDMRFCLRCHEADIARPAHFPQVDPADHGADQKCTECHDPHSPADLPPEPAAAPKVPPKK